LSCPNNDVQHSPFTIMVLVERFSRIFVVEEEDKKKEEEE
jgi:hypothetical protein